MRPDVIEEKSRSTLIAWHKARHDRDLCAFKEVKLALTEGLPEDDTFADALMHNGFLKSKELVNDFVLLHRQATQWWRLEEYLLLNCMSVQMKEAEGSPAVVLDMPSLTAWLNSFQFTLASRVSGTLEEVLKSRLKLPPLHAEEEGSQMRRGGRSCSPLHEDELVALSAACVLKIPIFVFRASCSAQDRLDTYLPPAADSLDAQVRPLYLAHAAGQYFHAQPGYMRSFDGRDAYPNS